MLASPLLLSLISLFLGQMMHVSAFVPSSTRMPRAVSCDVLGKNKKEVDIDRIMKSGIGGLNDSFKSSRTPKTTPKNNVQEKKSNVKNSAITPLKKPTQPTGSVFNVKLSEDTDLSKILVSLLIPWRNPNSIFLYLLIIVSVLGKINEQ